MSGRIRRRAFVALLAGAASTLSLLDARAQQKPVIGFLSNQTRGPHLDDELAAFHAGLKEHGYTEGRNLVIEYRWSAGRNDRLEGLAAELVQRKVAVIATSGGDASARAAKIATATIPIVFVSANDPVKIGLVASLNKPGGNVTGIYRLSSELLPKGLELISEVVPHAVEVAFLTNPSNPSSGSYVAIVDAAARTLGRRIKSVHASTDAEIDAVFAGLLQAGTGALQIGNDPFFSSRASRLGALTLRHRIPAIYSPPGFVQGGGLMRYGGSLADGYRLVGDYTGRILKGATPAELPVQQHSRVDFVINLQAAKALGLTIPVPLLARADAVIE
jgi:putative ABC transport system substrate-binding protein